MKKMSSCEFQRRFVKLQSRLKRGDTVKVTHRGQLAGIFTKVGPLQIKTPNFLANVRAQGYTRALGNQILREFNEVHSRRDD